MHDRGATRGRPPEGRQVQQIGTGSVCAIKADHVVAAVAQEVRHRDTYVAAMPSHENAHLAMIALTDTMDRGQSPYLLPRCGA